jgi:hypothetical protein
MNMKVGITAIIVTMFATMHLSQAVAQQKTVRACQEEWRANKAANQSAGITEKAYVAQCRGGGAAAQPTPPTGPAETTAAPAGAKTAKACREEWRSNKAENQAKGITEKAYVEQCRTGAATAAPTPAIPPPTSAAPPPAVQPTRPAALPPARPATPAQPTPSQTAAPPPAAPAPTTTARPAPQPPSATTGSNEFSTEAQAKAHCPADTIVWANLRSHVYHFGQTRYYGTTENGTYMCEKEAIAAGNRAAKNETHP